MTIDISAVISRLREIDAEIAQLYKKKIIYGTNFATEEPYQRIKKIPTDPYKIRMLKAERRELLKMAIEHGKQKARNMLSAYTTDSASNRENEAIRWGAKRYLEVFGAKAGKKVRKSRIVARETIDKFFPFISPEEHKRMIDSYRERIALEAKKLIKKE